MVRMMTLGSAFEGSTVRFWKGGDVGIDMLVELVLVRLCTRALRSFQMFAW